jgi:hypothetical protein
MEGARATLRQTGRSVGICQRLSLVVAGYCAAPCPVVAGAGFEACAGGGGVRGVVPVVVEAAGGVGRGAVLDLSET